jgi:hypothetical protein
MTAEEKENILVIQISVKQCVYILIRYMTVAGNKIVQVRENEHTKLKRSRNRIKTRVYIVKRHSISKSKSLPLCSFVRL